MAVPIRCSATFLGERALGLPKEPNDDRAKHVGGTSQKRLSDGTTQLAPHSR